MCGDESTILTPCFVLVQCTLIVARRLAIQFIKLRKMNALNNYYVQSQLLFCMDFLHVELALRLPRIKPVQFCMLINSNQKFY